MVVLLYFLQSTKNRINFMRHLCFFLSLSPSIHISSRDSNNHFIQRRHKISFHNGTMIFFSSATSSYERTKRIRMMGISIRRIVSKNEKHCNNTQKNCRLHASFFWDSKVVFHHHGGGKEGNEICSKSFIVSKKREMLHKKWELKKLSESFMSLNLFIALLWIIDIHQSSF